MVDDITPIADYEKKDVCYVCEWHLTNKKWFFMLLCEYLTIARHHFYGGNLLIHKAIQNKCHFQIIENLIQTWPELLMMMECCPLILLACIFLLTILWELSFLLTQKFDYQVQWYSIAVTWCCCKRSTIEF